MDSTQKVVVGSSVPTLIPNINHLKSYLPWNWKAFSPNPPEAVAERKNVSIGGPTLPAVEMIWRTHFPESGNTSGTSSLMEEKLLLRTDTAATLSIQKNYPIFPISTWQMSFPGAFTSGKGAIEDRLFWEGDYWFPGSTKDSGSGGIFCASSSGSKAVCFYLIDPDGTWGLFPAASSKNSVVLVGEESTSYTQLFTVWNFEGDSPKCLFRHGAYDAMTTDIDDSLIVGLSRDTKEIECWSPSEQKMVWKIEGDWIKSGTDTTLFGFGPYIPTKKLLLGILGTTYYAFDLSKPKCLWQVDIGAPSTLIYQSLVVEDSWLIAMTNSNFVNIISLEDGSRRMSLEIGLNPIAISGKNLVTLRLKDPTCPYLYNIEEKSSRMLNNAPWPISRLYVSGNKLIGTVNKYPGLPIFTAFAVWDLTTGAVVSSMQLPNECTLLDVGDSIMTYLLLDEPHKPKSPLHTTKKSASSPKESSSDYPFVPIAPQEKYPLYFWDIQKGALIGSVTEEITGIATGEDAWVDLSFKDMTLSACWQSEKQVFQFFIKKYQLS